MGDLPTSCNQCEHGTTHGYNRWCEIAKNNILMRNMVPAWCPLRKEAEDMGEMSELDIKIREAQGKAAERAKGAALSYLEHNRRHLAACGMLSQHMYKCLTCSKGKTEFCEDSSDLAIELDEIARGGMGRYE